MSDKKPDVGKTGRKIIYDEDGKPCRSCNTLEDFKLATGKGFMPKIPKSVTPKVVAESVAEPAQYVPGTKSYEKIDPPDVVELGKSTWNFLHTMTATYPKNPKEEQKKDMKNFLSIFSKVYPCSWCAKDFEDYIRKNSPKVESREELGRWMCEAHNAVNVKLNKEEFNCNFWEKRWRSGWDDE